MITSFDYYKQIESPIMYLCNPDKRPICVLNGQNRNLTLRFNDLSELTFEVDSDDDNYNFVESKRLVHIEKIGWFQITGVDENITGNQKRKSVSALSHQYGFKNRGFVIEERLYMFYNPNDEYDVNYKSCNKEAIPSIIGQLNKQLGIKVDLKGINYEPTEDYDDWTITYINPMLKFDAQSYDKMYIPSENAENICRGFNANSNCNGYDFMVNQVESAFEVIFEFDYLNHAIKIKTLDEVTKPTDIYLSHDNIIQSLNIKENSEDIVTVLSCYGNNLDIRTVNPMGTNYIVNFDYYMKVIENEDGTKEYPWMSKELIDTLKEWKDKYSEFLNDGISIDNKQIKSYQSLVIELQKAESELLKIENAIKYANLKLFDLNNVKDNTNGFISAETVEVNQNSLLKISCFNENKFTDESTVEAHKTAPKLDNGCFVFGDVGESGTVKKHIEKFTQNAKDNDSNVDKPSLYFMDEDAKSYCKITIGSEVGVVKDEEGNILKNQNGIVTVKGEKFIVELGANSLKITCPDNSIVNSANNDFYFNYNGNRYRLLKKTDGIISIHAFFVSGFERYTTYTEIGGVKGWRYIWENHINCFLEPEKMKIKTNNIEPIKNEMQLISDNCNVEKYVRKQGANLYDELSAYWIEGEYTNDKLATFDTTTISERIGFAKELMKAGEIELNKVSQPQIELSIDAINFIKMYEFREFTNELALGRRIIVEKSDDEHYELALMTLEYDLDKSDSFGLTFSNATKPGDTTMSIADLIKESSSTTRTVTTNWSNLTDYSRNKENIMDLIKSPLDMTLRATQSNMVNQNFIIDNSGILGRKYDTEFDGANGTFLPEQIRIVNNTILFTDDNWATARTALGKVVYSENGNNKEAYGLIADVLVGNLILGNSMKISNASNNITLDSDGICIKSPDGTDTIFRASQDGSITLNNTDSSIVLDSNGLIIKNKDSNTEVFKATTDGTLTLTGSINATGGKIGGYNIGDTMLYNGEVGMSGTGGISFWAGSETASNAPFKVTNTGELTASKGVIGGLTMGKELQISASTKVETSFLSSNNFKIASVSLYTEDDQDKAQESTYLYFYDKQNNSITTSIEDGIIRTNEIIAQNMLSGNKAQIANIKIDGNYISGNSASIYFGGSTQSKNIGRLKIDGKKIIVYFEKHLNKDVTVEIKYKLIWDSNWKYAKITLSKGSLEKSFDTKAAIGIDMYSFRYTGYEYHVIDEDHIPAIGFQASIKPLYGQAYGLGDDAHPWSFVYGDRGYYNQLYLKGASISSSDKKYKIDIALLNEQHGKFFDFLTPVSYRFRAGTSGRTHIGLIANEVKEAIVNAGLDAKDMACYCEWDENGERGSGIRYEELIPLCIFEIKKLKEEIKKIQKY